MGKPQRDQQQSLDRIAEVLSDLGEVHVVAPTPHTRDVRQVVLASLLITCQVVIHADGIAIEAWVGGERVACMQPGQEKELVLYAVLVKQKILMTSLRDGLRTCTEFFKKVQMEDPETFARFKAIGEGPKDLEKPG